MHEFPDNFCFHGELREWLYSGTPENPHGYVDGWAIAKTPELVKEHFVGYPIVVIKRDINDVLASWKKWSPGDLDLSEVRQASYNMGEFLGWLAHRGDCMVVAYSMLRTYEICDAIAKYCTGRPLNYTTWRTFDRFKIEVKK
jgi:hypothetical protein